MRALLVLSIAIACCAGVALGDPAADPPSAAPGSPGPSQGQAKAMLASPKRAPVEVLRGTSRVPSEPAAVSVEVLSFGNAGSQRVTVARGSHWGIRTKVVAYRDGQLRRPGPDVRKHYPGVCRARFYS